MTREELEEEVFKRLTVEPPVLKPAVRDALKQKTTAQLEDLLRRMKAEGR